MTVKDLIKELLECNMESEVSIEGWNDQDGTYHVIERFEVVDCDGRCLIEECEFEKNYDGSYYF